MAPTLPRIDLRMEDLERLVDRTRHTPLTEGEHATLKAAIDTLGYLAHLVEQKGTTLDGLRQLLFGATTEKTRDVLARAGVDTPPAPRAPRDDEPDRDAGGHGRHGAAAYTGARQVPVPHAQLHYGDRCPSCTGTVYRQRDPRVLIRLVGQAPITATVYALEKLRCHLCGELFTADPPAGVGAEKYDATTGAMVALLKYGSGMPFHRLERLQANLQIPLPASTQWEIVADTATRLQPALAELTRQAAQGELVHNDDTRMTVLDLDRPGAPRDDDVSPDRTGVFTSGIVATREGHRIALFRTGRRHAGEIPRAGARRASGRAGAADPDVRCPRPESAASAGGDPRELSGARAAPVCGGHPEFSGRVSPRARDAARGVSPRRRRAGAGPFPRRAARVSPGA